MATAVAPAVTPTAVALDELAFWLFQPLAPASNAAASPKADACDLILPYRLSWV
ncbi:MAG: hypothetical protein Q7U28_06425 [Aquabacterium sp.]|nr:hypothetical protein [Aquabacterium sp.]